jgi:DNA-binding transcriptional LysR family regulator
MIQPDLLSLKAFVSVAREGSVSKAANTLYLTQPAVSLQLKSLQERLNLKLFERAGRGLVLTRDGAALLPQAEKVLSALQDFAHNAHRMQSALRGRLRIGTILDPEFTRLGAFLKELVEAAPHVETELSQHMSGQVLKRLHANELDAGFYLSTPQEWQGLRQTSTTSAAAQIAARQIDFNPYFFEGNHDPAPEKYTLDAMQLIAIELTRFNYRVLAPASWGPQVRGKDWAQLAVLPWVLTPPQSVHFRLLREVFMPLNLAPKRAALVDQEASMLDLVRSGVGLSLARDSIAMREAHSRGLVVADRVQLPCVLGFVHSAAQQSSAVMQAVRLALGKVWPSPTSDGQ